VNVAVNLHPESAPNPAISCTQRNISAIIRHDATSPRPRVLGSMRGLLLLIPCAGCLMGPTDHDPIEPPPPVSLLRRGPDLITLCANGTYFADGLEAGEGRWGDIPPHEGGPGIVLANGPTGERVAELYNADGWIATALFGEELVAATHACDALETRPWFGIDLPQPLAVQKLVDYFPTLDACLDYWVANPPLDGPAPATYCFDRYLFCPDATFAAVLSDRPWSGTYETSFGRLIIRDGVQQLFSGLFASDTFTTGTTTWTRIDPPVDLGLGACP
jgi:hypothetical protein